MRAPGCAATRPLSHCTPDPELGCVPVRIPWRLPASYGSSVLFCALPVYSLSSCHFYFQSVSCWNTHRAPRSGGAPAALEPAVVPQRSVGSGVLAAAQYGRKRLCLQPSRQLRSTPARSRAHHGARSGSWGPGLSGLSLCLRRSRKQGPPLPPSPPSVRVATFVGSSALAARQGPRPRGMCPPAGGQRAPFLHLASVRPSPTLSANFCNKWLEVGAPWLKAERADRERVIGAGRAHAGSGLSQSQSSPPVGTRPR